MSRTIDAKADTDGGRSTINEVSSKCPFPCCPAELVNLTGQYWSELRPVGRGARTDASHLGALNNANPQRRSQTLCRAVSTRIASVFRQGTERISLLVR